MADDGDAGFFTCFGYGSLVNRQTLPTDARSIRVRVQGWRRAWRLTADKTGRPRCTLTVVPDPECTILGTVISQSHDHDGAMLQREALYERQQLEGTSVDWLDDRPHNWPQPFIHVGVAEHCRCGDDDHPVLLSYIDTVLTGYLDTFGEDGPRHFVDTTADWHVPILDDRRTPHYSRATSLTGDEREQVDVILAGLGVRMIKV